MDYQGGLRDLSAGDWLVSGEGSTQVPLEADDGVSSF